MKELSLHILDIFYNSLKANASLIKISIITDTKKDLLTIKIIDNGYGMDKDFLKEVLNPFKTSRTTRKVGLGLSLFEASANRCEGYLKIWSKKNFGTVVTVTFKNSHIDRAPIGDMVETVISMIISLSMNQNLIYVQALDDEEFVLDTREIRQALGEDIPLGEPDVVMFIRDYLKEGLKSITEE